MGTPFTGAPPTPAHTDLTGEWFTERFTNHEWHAHRFRKTLVQTRTKFQNAILADSYTFGRCLILDGEMQSAQLDEFIYHECLVHPALVTHGRARDVLVLGGGEGATVREILRHPSVRRATMVDIDREVVAFSKQYLKEWHHGAMGNSKCRVVIGDARQFVFDSSETFDVIISDLPTAADGGPAHLLYTIEFYRRMLKRLRPGGVFIAQAGSGSLVQLEFHAVLASTLRNVFKVVRPYYAFVPSFDVPWAYLLCTQRADPQAITSAAVDRRLGTLKKHLRFYDGEAHQHLFHVPKYIRTMLRQERRVLSEKTKRA